LNRLGILIPVFNEENKIQTIFHGYQKVRSRLKREQLNSRLVFIDDGSEDRSAALIHQLAEEYRIAGDLIRLKKNFGKDNALIAGLQHTRCDYYAVVDADLQTPLETLPAMARKIRNENLDIVRAVKENEPYGLVRKILTAVFFKLARLLKIKEFKKGSSDFILFNKKVKEDILQLKEKEFLIRAMIAWHHFREGSVSFTPPVSSKPTKYSLKKLFIMGLRSIVTFSNFLRINFIISICYWIAALVYGSIILYNKITNRIVTGLSSTLLLILISFALLFLMLAIFGEILKIIFEEIKQRPRYLIETISRYETQDQAD